MPRGITKHFSRRSNFHEWKLELLEAVDLGPQVADCVLEFAEWSGKRGRYTSLKITVATSAFR
jgi:hypothetical protein